jgi:acyl carrier protein
MEQKIIEILSSLKSGVDFATAEGIVTNKLIDSIDIATMITRLEDDFDIEISMEYMENSNFDSVAAISEMIQEIQGD